MTTKSSTIITTVTLSKGEVLSNILDLLHKRKQELDQKLKSASDEISKRKYNLVCPYLDKKFSKKIQKIKNQYLEAFKVFHPKRKLPELKTKWKEWSTYWEWFCQSPSEEFIFRHERITFTEPFPKKIQEKLEILKEKEKDQWTTLNPNKYSYKNPNADIAADYIWRLSLDNDPEFQELFNKLQNYVHKVEIPHHDPN